MSTTPNQNASFNNLFDYGGGALGKDQQTGQAFASAIGVGAGLFLIQASIYQLLKSSRRFQRIYQPRTYLLPERQKSDAIPTGLFAWFQRIWRLDKQQIVSKNGLDVYVFLRYFRMLLKIFVPLAFIVPVILLPINTINGNYQKPVPFTDPQQYYNTTGLSSLSWSNVNAEKPELYWAHCILALLVIVWCCYNFFDELVDFIAARQEYLTSPEHRLRASSSTVLIMNIPPDFMTEKALMDLFDVFPGGIRKMWLNRNLDPLAYKVSRRRDLVGHLEDAETNLIRNSNQKYLDQEKKKTKKDKKAGKDAAARSPSAQTTSSTTEVASPPLSSEARRNGNTSQDQNDTDGVVDTKSITSRKSGESSAVADEKYAVDAPDTALWQKYLKKGDRDTMRILRFGWTFFTSVPLYTVIGILMIPITKSVDRIYYSRQEIAKLNREIERDQDNIEQYPFLNSAFIQFNNQAAAHMCVQTTIHHSPAMMNPRIIEIGPNNVLWENLSLPWWHKRIREIIVLGLFVAILFLWGIPFAIAGIISNISTIGTSVHWLAWITTIPKPALNVIQGLLPPFLIQLLITLGLPALLRLLCHLSGVPSRTQGESMLQRYYFAFLFIEVFLVSTVSSGLTAVIQNIVRQPYDIPQQLAENLPKASNYFLSYVILQALSVSAGQLLQTGRLFVVGWAKTFLNPKPRTLFYKKIFMQHNKWGQVFPFFTNIACIAIIYSVISPIILFEILLTFSLFWLVYRNNSIFVYRNQIDSTGMLFPTAVFQLFTGLYVFELCLIGLFFLARKPGSDDLVCYPQAIFMIVVICLTIAYHYSLHALLSPLLSHVPITLEDDAVIRDKQYEDAMYKRLGMLGKDAEGSTSLDGKSEADHSQKVPGHNHDTHERKWYQRRTRDSTQATTDSVLARLRKRHGGHDSKDLRPQRTRDDAQLHTKPSNEAKLEHPDAEKGNVKGEDAIPGILAQFNAELSDLLPADRDALVEVAYTNPALRERRPIIWIPQDDLGVADDEIAHMHKYTKFIDASTKGAYFKEKSLASGITEAPPDFSEYWLIEPEL